MSTLSLEREHELMERSPFQEAMRRVGGQAKHAGVDLEVYGIDGAGEVLVDTRDPLKDLDAPIAAGVLSTLALAHAVEISGAIMEQALPLRDADRRHSGVLRFLPANHRVTTGKALELMLSEKDPTATSHISHMLGGRQSVNELLASSPLDLKATRLQSDRDTHLTYGLTTIPESMALMGHLLRDGEASPAARIAAFALHHSSLIFGLRKEINRAQPVSDRATLEKDLEMLMRLRRRLGPIDKKRRERLYNENCQEAISEQGHWPASVAATIGGSDKGMAYELAQIKGLTLFVSGNKKGYEGAFDAAHPVVKHFGKIGTLLTGATFRTQPRQVAAAA
ncbi:MAG: hypothetical protein JWL85_586 [Candidatus Saccharibacteria bacterium]|nr:hypothetical protein [Candidatus Saccharibacteria bacterium]